ncbi:MAG: polyprenyl synthetase family protein [Bacteroidales bacterium]|nr:polyprenyl synthetase family protein [Bacteroidales bacterium]
MYTVSELADRINNAIQTLPLNREPEGLYKPISYVLSLGGKRVRPILMLLTYNMYKERIDNEVIHVALAVETYHNFTLLHDDLMDCADERRGKKTVHKVWNDNVAILSGDAMLILAYQYLSQIDDPEYFSLIFPEFSKFALEICEGQQYDMDFEERTDVHADDYLRMIKLKTSVLLAGSMKIGGILADASKDDQELLYNVGLYTGLAFQLKDDLLDVYGDPKLFGKKIGKDIISNKKTYLMIKAFEKANEKQKKELSHWISLKEFSPAEKIAAITAIYNDLSIKSVVEDKMNSFYNQALVNLEKVNIDSERKKQLILFLNQLMDREV